MVNAVGIGVLAKNPNNDPRAMLYLKACYLYGVPAFIFPVYEVETAIHSGYIHAFRWTEDGLERFTTEPPRFFEFYASLNSIKKVSQEYYQWIIDNTILTDAFGLSKERLERELLLSPLSQYAIPTFQTRTFQDIIGVLRAIPSALLKPAEGNLGIGIMHLNRENNRILYATAETTGVFSEESFENYRMALPKNYGTFLVEPCINIRSKDGRAIDFRVQVSLNGAAQWEIGFACARIGGNGIASNFERGGSLTTPELGMRLLDVENPAEKVDELFWLAIEAAKLVQITAKSAVSCLGIDICVDYDTKQLYVLEANSKPGGRIISLFHLAEVRASYFKYLLST